MRLSYTALKTFQECRFRFHLRYHRSLASRPRPPMRFSRALHGALQLFHQSLKQKKDGEEDLFPIPDSLDSLLAHFTRYYENPTRPLTESQYQEGRAVLARYWEAHQGKFPTPYLLEEPFTLHVGPFLLGGHFDRVDLTHPRGMSSSTTSSPNEARFRQTLYSLTSTSLAFMPRPARWQRSSRFTT